VDNGCGKVYNDVESGLHPKPSQGQKTKKTSPDGGVLNKRLPVRRRGSLGTASKPGLAVESSESKCDQAAWSATLEISANGLAFDHMLKNENHEVSVSETESSSQPTGTPQNNLTVSLSVRPVNALHQQDLTINFSYQQESMCKSCNYEDCGCHEMKAPILESPEEMITETDCDADASAPFHKQKLHRRHRRRYSM